MASRCEQAEVEPNYDFFFSFSIPLFHWLAIRYYHISLFPLINDNHRSFIRILLLILLFLIIYPKASVWSNYLWNTVRGVSTLPTFLLIRNGENLWVFKRTISWHIGNTKAGQSYHSTVVVKTTRFYSTNFNRVLICLALS